MEELDMNIDYGQKFLPCAIVLAMGMPALAQDSHFNISSPAGFRSLPILRSQSLFVQKKIAMPCNQIAHESNLTKLGYYLINNENGNSYPLFERPSLKLRFWTDDCEHRLAQARTRFSEQLDSIRTGTRCTFYVKPNGDIGDPFMWWSSGSKKTDDSVLRCIAAAGPFNNPPVEFSDKQRFLVLFTAKPSVEMFVDTKAYDGWQDRDRMFQYLKQHPSDRMTPNHP